MKVVVGLLSLVFFLATSPVRAQSADPAGAIPTDSEFSAAAKLDNDKVPRRGLKDIRNDRNDIHHDEADIKSDRKDLKGDVSDRNKDNKDIQSDDKDIKSDVNDRNKDNKDIQSDKKDLKNDVDDRTADEKNISKEKQKLKQDEKKFGKNSPQACHDRDVIAKDRTDLKNDNKDIRSDGKDLKGDVADRNKDNKDIRSDKKDLKGDVADRNKDNKDIQSDKKDLKSDHTDLNKDKKDLANDIKNSRNYTKLDVDFIPLLNFDLGISKKVVNLTPNPPTNSQTDSLHLDVYGAGFRVTRYRNVDVSAGAGLLFHFIGASQAAKLFNAGLGLMAVHGSTAIVTRYAATQSDIDSVENVKLPFSAADLATWAVKDSVTYQTTGGVLFTGAAGYGMVGGSVSFLASGQWVTYVEKTGENQVFVKITKGKLKSLSATAGTLIGGVSLSEFRDADESWGFSYDLSQTQSAQAYEDVLKGNMATTQSLAAANSSITPDFTSKSRTIGRFSSAWFGIPMFLNVQVASGKIYNFTDTVSALDGKETQVQYGLYVHEKSSEVFFHETSHVLQAFYGVSSLGSQTGRFVFQYGKEHANSKDVLHWITDLKKQTGLSDLLTVPVPKADSLGYAEADLTVELSPASTASLMAAPTDKTVFAKITQAALQTVEAYFVNGDADGYCTSVRPEDQDQCRSDITADTKDALNQMRENLTKMQQAQDQESFVKAYAAFGKAAMKNEFSFHALTRLATVTVSYKIEGQRLAKFKKAFNVAL